MKSFILIFGTFLLSTSLFGGTFGITLSVEPENPIAGEEVTFTVNNLEFFFAVRISKTREPDLP